MFTPQDPFGRRRPRRRRASVCQPGIGARLLVKSDPAANATVASPKTITLTFAEELTPGVSGFDVVMGDGERPPRRR